MKSQTLHLNFPSIVNIHVIIYIKTYPHTHTHNTGHLPIAYVLSWYHEFRVVSISTTHLSSIQLFLSWVPGGFLIHHPSFPILISCILGSGVVSLSTTHPSPFQLFMHWSLIYIVTVKHHPMDPITRLVLTIIHTQFH